MNKCQFCGSREHSIFTGEYTCGSDGNTGVRTKMCYERQLAHQTALLREALEVVEVVNKGEMYVTVTRNSHGEFTFNSLRIADDDDLLVLSKAQALAPKIREALEEK